MMGDWPPSCRSHEGCSFEEGLRSWGCEANQQSGVPRMNVHKNARLTPSGRVLLVQRIEQGWRVGRAAAASGVSERTAYRWPGRYRSGDHQLGDRRSAPRWCPHRLDEEVVKRIEERRVKSSLAIEAEWLSLIVRRDCSGRRPDREVAHGSWEPARYRPPVPQVMQGAA